MSNIEARLHAAAHADPAMRAARWRTLRRGLRDAEARLVDAERRLPASHELTADMKMLVRLFERRCEKARNEAVAATRVERAHPGRTALPGDPERP